MSSTLGLNSNDLTTYTALCKKANKEQLYKMIEQIRKEINEYSERGSN